ncbi:hypothetical protein A6J60_001015 [Psychrobacter sp. FDAARGOS_221]|nr:hypothetical protein A6J60_001015 [Psychrobacter sp. FDAARGOS_221]
MLLRLGLVLLALLLFITSFTIDSGGGLAISSYIVEGDLYQISHLQGTGGSDSIFIIISSFMLLITFCVTALIKSSWEGVQYTLFLCWLILSSLLLGLMETAPFLNISYSTVFIAKNCHYILWFGLYLLLYGLVVIKLIFIVIDRQSKWTA